MHSLFCLENRRQNVTHRSRTFRNLPNRHHAIIKTTKYCRPDFFGFIISKTPVFDAVKISAKLKLLPI